MMRTVKRDGEIEAFDPAKIKRALLLAFNHVGAVPNVAPLVRDVMAALRVVVEDKTVTVADVAACTENVLMDAGHHSVAKAYIIYRHDRAKVRERLRSPDANALPSYIVASKYARHSVSLGRREVWDEICSRDEMMMHNRFADRGIEFAGLIQRAYGFMRRKEVLPSMRSAQFAGAAMESDNARGYNCSFTLIDRWRAFQEGFYLLLCGCGVGYSVQWRHIDQLSPILRVDRGRVIHHTVADTIIGWADALGALVESFTVSGTWVEFNYSGVRAEGVPLKTSGGKAPGHLPLRAALEKIRGLLLAAQGRRIRPIEGSDIMCLLAEAVLAGGIRRSSLIGLFDANNDEMIYAKARGNFDPSPMGLNSHRQMVNLSAVLLRGATHRSVFDRLVRVAEENFGDPGFIFVNNLDHGTNPCGEIGLEPVLSGPCIFCAPGGAKVREDLGLEGGTCVLCDGAKVIKATGFAFCNLCEVNMATVSGVEDYLDRCWAAAFIGTLQASFTSFPYLGPVTEAIAERDALLGIGMCGIQNNRELALDPEIQRQGALECIRVNTEVSQIIGINAAARVTTVKPGGTGPLVLGMVGAGIHRGWAPRAFRRVTASPSEACAQEFRRVNPHMVDVKPDGDWSLVFPVEFSGATLRSETALGFCDDVMNVYTNWVLPGTVRGSLTHNVSCSVTLRPGERAAVCDYIWEHKESIAAMSFIPLLIDQRFPYAPWQACLTAADEARWDHLVSQYRAVDWTQFREDQDSTTLRMSVACGSDGVCAL